MKAIEPEILRKCELLINDKLNDVLSNFGIERCSSSMSFSEPKIIHIVESFMECKLEYYNNNYCDLICDAILPKLFLNVKETGLYFKSFKEVQLASRTIGLISAVEAILIID